MRSRWCASVTPKCVTPSSKYPETLKRRQSEPWWSARFASSRQGSQHHLGTSCRKKPVHVTNHEEEQGIGPRLGWQQPASKVLEKKVVERVVALFSVPGTTEQCSEATRFFGMFLNDARASRLNAVLATPSLLPPTHQAPSPMRTFPQVTWPHSVETTAARVCREARERVMAYVPSLDLVLDRAYHRFDKRRFEVTADDQGLFGGFRLAIDATLVSTLQPDGSPRQGADDK